MMHLTDHAKVAGSILNLNDLRDLTKTKCDQSTLLINGSTDTALNLLYFNCCHCFYSLINR